MFGTIVLRDVPKEEARIDLIRYEIKGGFRGFRMVPPGLHYVSVKLREHHVGFWCWLKPSEAVVRVFDYQDGFGEDDPETEAQYTQMALNGAMNQVLMEYVPEKFGPWFGLVSHIGAENFPPPLHAQDEGAGSRFDNALGGTHGGDAAAFLAEFQFAFVRWLVSLDTASEDEAAFARWRHLLLAAYNAGEDRIRDAGGLFPNLVDTMLRQFALLPDDWFAGGSFLTQQADYMAEDMIDTEVEEIAAKGREFADYLAAR